MRTKGPRVQKTCKQCGEPFEVHPYRADTANFCSISCASKSRTGERAARWSGGKVKNICEKCGKEYDMWPHLVGISRFCSHSCQTSFINAGERSHLWKGGKKAVTNCPQCGKEIVFCAGQTRRRKYCSTACHDAARMKRTTFVCEECGKSFQRKHSHIRNEFQFCSQECYRKHRPTFIEAAIHKGLREQGVEFIPEHPVGRFFIDVFIPSANLAVECDGFYWHKNRAKQDAARDRYLAKCGITVLRLPEADILERPEQCVQRILCLL